MTNVLPVVVVGAGPIGLAAAAQLLERGLEPLVLEAGPAAGASVRQWHHVRLFSRWGELVDPAAAKLLAPTGWSPPDPDTYPTGRGVGRATYLQPLADALGERVRFGARVIGVARRGRDRVVDAGRDSEPLTVHVRRRAAGRRSGSPRARWSTPPAPGRRRTRSAPTACRRWASAAAADRIAYQVPDLTDPAVRARYAGRRVAVAGSGHSALTALVAFAELAEQEPGTHVEWLLRRGQIGDTRSAAARPTSCPPAGALGGRAADAVDGGAHHGGDRVPHRRRRTGRGRPVVCWSPRTGDGSTRSTRWWR